MLRLPTSGRCTRRYEADYLGGAPFTGQVIAPQVSAESDRPDSATHEDRAGLALILHPQGAALPDPDQHDRGAWRRRRAD
jgi:hypothetical protein